MLEQGLHPRNHPRRIRHDRRQHGRPPPPRARAPHRVPGPSGRRPGLPASACSSGTATSAAGADTQPPPRPRTSSDSPPHSRWRSPARSRSASWRRPSGPPRPGSATSTTSSSPTAPATAADPGLRPLARAAILRDNQRDANRQRRRQRTRATDAHGGRHQRALPPRGAGVRAGRPPPRKWTPPPSSTETPHAITATAYYPAERPLAMQLLGGDPDVLADSGASLLRPAGPTSIDLNMGCPVAKIVEQGARARPSCAIVPLAGVIFRAMRAGRARSRFTIKIRGGWDDHAPERGRGRADGRERGRRRHHRAPAHAQPSSSRVKRAVGRSSPSVVDAVRVPVIGQRGRGQSMADARADARRRQGATP